MYGKVLMLQISFLMSVALAQAGTAVPSGALALTSFGCGQVAALPALFAGQVSQSTEAALGGLLDHGRCRCPNSPAKTARLEGRGPSCAAALDNLSNLTDDQVSANCALGSDGVCSEGNVIVTIYCAYNPREGAYSVTGYRYYTCQYC